MVHVSWESAIMRSALPLVSHLLFSVSVVRSLPVVSRANTVRLFHSPPELSAETIANPIKIRCRARVAYDGSNFAGFQIQHHKQKDPPRTIQGELERVLSQRFGGQPIRVVGAGRTDAGVHARGQACHFDVVVGDVLESGDNNPSRKGQAALENMFIQDISGVQNSIERMLPPDLALWNLQVAPKPLTKLIDGQWQEKEWNVMYDSKLKMYSYRIHVGPVMNPLQRRTRWHPDRVQNWFDHEKFERLIKSFEGTHDFRAFAGAIEQLELSKRKYLLEKQTKKNISVMEDNVFEDEDNNGNLVNTVRTVKSVNFSPELHEDEYSYRIDFLLEGALYKQVRNMVGTVMEVCRYGGRITESDFYELLHSRSKVRGDNLSKPAPPQGLTLEHVYFENEKSGNNYLF